MSWHHLPWTVILPRVLALPAELVAKHMYWPESSAVMLSKMSVQEPSGSSMMMWWGSASTGRPSESSKWQQCNLLFHQHATRHCIYFEVFSTARRTWWKMECVPLYQVIRGFGTPVALQASLTVCPSSAVQLARISTKSGGPVAAKSWLINTTGDSMRMRNTIVHQS